MKSASAAHIILVSAQAQMQQGTHTRTRTHACMYIAILIQKNRHNLDSYTYKNHIKLATYMASYIAIGLLC